MKVVTRQKPVVFTVANAKQALKKTWEALLNGNIALNAAGVAYFGTLSFFPLIAALVAIAGMTLAPTQMDQIVLGITHLMPKDIASLVTTQLQHAAEHQQTNIWIFWGALLLSLYGVSGAIENTIKAINSTYNISDTRNFFVQKGLSIGLTLLFILGMAVVLPLIFVGPGLLAEWHVPGAVIAVLSWSRWLVLLVLAMTGLGVLYHYAPNIKDRAWRWISWGSIIATALWLLITQVLFIYLQNFANFSNAYSLFAGIIALMMWINFSATAVLVGAAVNKSFEQSLAKK